MQPPNCVIISWFHKKSNCDDVYYENEGTCTYMYFLPLKFSQYPSQPVPVTRTFWQVPGPSRPEVKNPYPSDPAHRAQERSWTQKICGSLPPLFTIVLTVLCSLYNLYKLCGSVSCGFKSFKGFIFLICFFCHGTLGVL